MQPRSLPASIPSILSILDRESTRSRASGACVENGARRSSVQYAQPYVFAPLKTMQRVIAAIPPEWRPTSFQAWAQPGRITGAAANELWRSLLEYLDDPKAPAVGTRLRLGRDSQNVNSRDAH
ncbi:hypothetical protein HPB50_021008 [Hyalomma asiaticum]|uniref:Uncharacterized protein n=1 Tax=Hyalomma asiaticum TaxID=266040 RepID=A0ACB7SP29_HYAAI|nr:hypothetical protein HPB50_021008 [Hyalomma asiaticum]